MDLVSESLHFVRLNQGARCFAFRMDGVDDVAGVLLRIVSPAVDVSIGFAAAILRRKTGFIDRRCYACKTIEHGCVLCIKAIC